MHMYMCMWEWGNGLTTDFEVHVGIASLHFHDHNILFSSQVPLSRRYGVTMSPKNGVFVRIEHR